ncbi:acyl-CoA N-acyltransferase [Catenaria anguillulae PL171]|uniref:Acyl-CoA N-acyltransferase n=1 Tax=Catenaria anguillulae PL171 TaxID=765915 RepID=A0A1Y2H768_9FUNG|nr:acyl-CoA N-acyltransferase [Catenaria anguillulae PL171]
MLRTPYPTLGAIHVTRFRPSDADSLLACLSLDKLIHDATLRVPWPPTKAYVDDFLAKHADNGNGRELGQLDSHLWAIRIDDSPSTAVVGLLGWDPSELPTDRSTLQAQCAHIKWTVGYWLSTPYRGMGILPLVLQHLVLSTAWRNRHVVARVELVTHVSNAPSRSVAEKAGIVLEGVRRAAAVKGGEVRDNCVYSWIPARDGGDDVDLNC